LTRRWPARAVTGGPKIVFDIIDNHLLGNDFALSWAMTYANDVIQVEGAGHDQKD
jgi:hypothetical protein